MKITQTRKFDLKYLFRSIHCKWANQIVNHSNLGRKKNHIPSSIVPFETAMWKLELRSQRIRIHLLLDLGIDVAPLSHCPLALLASSSSAATNRRPLVHSAANTPLGQASTHAARATQVLSGRVSSLYFVARLLDLDARCLGGSGALAVSTLISGCKYKHISLITMNKHFDFYSVYIFFEKTIGNDPTIYTHTQRRRLN